MTFQTKEPTMSTLDIVERRRRIAEAIANNITNPTPTSKRELIDRIAKVLAQLGVE